MAKFKVGDEIVAKGFTSSMDGKHGKIKSYDGTGWRPYEVEFEDGQTFMLYDTEMELLEEEKEMTGFEVLLKHWGLKVWEKFNIKEGKYNPYYFDKNMNLIDCDSDKAFLDTWNLVTGKLTIQKNEIKEMTVEEIEKELNIPKGTLRVKGDQ